MPSPLSVFPVQWRIQFLVPIAGNDGTLFLASYFQELERHLTDAVRAFSNRESLVRGVWYECRDSSREYFVDVDNAELAADLAIAITQFVASRFDQLAISLTVTPHYTTLSLSIEEIGSLTTQFKWQPREVTYARSA